MHVPADRLVDAAHEAKAAGAGGLLVLPGLSGFDAVRALAEDDALGLPLMSHPSFLGSNVVNRGQGIDHGLLFGTLSRLAGVDLSIFPHFGGRFSFSPDECLSIRYRCSAPLGTLAPAWPAPGGGLTLDRFDELVGFYGPSITVLVGGAVQRGDLAANAAALVRRAQTY